MRRFIVLMCLAVLCLPTAHAEDIPSLAKVYEGKFRFGFGGTNDRLVREGLADPNSKITAIVAGQSNIININCFYPNAIRSKRGVWQWEKCDQLMAFADQHPEWPRRAHILFWPFNEQNHMDWLIRQDDGTPVARDEAARRLRDYIHTVMGRYKGKFEYWDVVNEVIDHRQPDGMRKGLWKDVLGTEVVELAFRYAREADPSAKLYYNDFAEWVPAKRELIFKLVKGLKDKGLIDGIGLQQHLTMTEPTARQLDETIARYAELGLDIQITELDVEMNKDGSLTEFTPEMGAAQAKRYRELFDVYLKHADKISAVMTWNVTDATSWLRNHPRPHVTWPLLFDGEGKPKPAFWSVAKPIENPSVK